MSELDHDKRDVFRSIGRDQKLKEEIIEQVTGQRPQAGLQRGAGPARSLELPGGSGEADLANDILDGGFGGDGRLEAIIQLKGRPVIRVFGNDLVSADIPTERLREQLDPNRGMIRSVIPSVGRIELTGHSRFPWVGTGWVIDDDIIVTNRHVAREFGFFTGATYRFLPGVFGRPIGVQIDFLEEHDNDESEEFKISEVLFIEPEGGPDIALLRVDWATGNGSRQKLDLWEDSFDTDRQVAVIGYPARDTRTNIPATMDEIFDRIYNVKRFSPGFVISASDETGLLTHDCTTLGGNSGSTVVDLASGKAVALHFAGKEQQANYAVMAPVVKSRLNQVKTGITVGGRGGDFTNEVVEEKPSIEDMADRTGYDPDFLGVRVDLPGMTDEMRDQLAPVAGRDDGELKYTHYSVLMNKLRRVACYAVVNIDGNQLHGIPRATDKWYFDPRISLDHQVGNVLYKSNPLDRGHLVRRLDPSWGSDRGIAELAIEDSFFYTNSAPQHLSLNRRTWLRLEDHILNNSGDFNLRVSVFSGPVFRDDDEEYRGIKIPEGEAGAGELSVTAYVLSQRSLIDDLEFVFGEHQGFQVRLEVIEELTGLDFGTLKDADPLSRVSDTEAVGVGATRRGRRLFSLRDISL
jgi:endonuclease G